LYKKGFYYTEYITSQLIKSLNPETFQNPLDLLGLNDRETQFIKLSCSDLTYAEIADKMCVSPRTVDGYRESVFQKMNVKSRVGMVLEAIRLKIFEV
jgi:two-component system invasion response regulator UvrY